MSISVAVNQESRRLYVKGLRRSHLDHIEFSVARGETIGVRGSSGGGKTLMLRAIADLDAHEGAIEFDGMSYLAMSAPQWRRHVMWLPAEPQWWSDIAAEHFAELPTVHALAAVNLEQAVLYQPMRQLSEGQRQRLAILRMLSLRPSVLLLDEPTARMDGENVVAVERLIGEYQVENGAAIVWVSHDERQLVRVARRFFRMNAGQLTEEVSSHDSSEHA